MLYQDNKYKVLSVFFEDPLSVGGFQLREISRKAKLAPKSVLRYLTELVQEGMVTKKKHRSHNYPVYYANRDSEQFRFYKKMDAIYALKELGLVRHLEDFLPEAIVLFGSASRGEDVLESDIDLFVACKEKKLDLSKFEKKIKRKINIFFEPDFTKLSKELKNNIINGVILSGYLKVF